MERRKLLDAKMIKSGYLAYPARLMVKGGNDTSYHLHKDYSKIDIIFKTQ